MVFEPLLNANVAYDPERDYVPIAGVTRAPFFLVVNGTLPVQTTKEFVALARSKPGVLSYGSAGAGTSTGTVAELFKRTAQIDLTHVPYKGDGQAFADLIGGHIDAQFVAYPVIAEMLRAGRVRALMHTGEGRIPAAPQVPSASQEGYPEVTVYGRIGVFVPAKTPAAIVQRPIHRRGVSAQRGLYFLGLRLLHKLKSSFLRGVGEDAAYIAQPIATRT
jgi:tripartite-type tricarboxylate transporter receptor subunit TctC